MVSVQSGSALAKGLFVYATPLGVAWLRLTWAALVLIPLTRPRWRQYTWRDYRLLLCFGLTIGAMNALLYSAIAYIPLGVAVTLEFTGPLGVALAHARRPLDGLWILLAALGIALLSPWSGASFHPVGVALALGSGVCWGTYILLSERASRVFRGSEGVAMAMAAGSLGFFPLALAQNGPSLFHPPLLLLGLGLAILASAIPYSLEMMALRRLPLKVFGVLMSLEPVTATLVGLMILGEQLTIPTGIAILLVSIAAAGSARNPH
jgi:Predicted permease, DMT superfamily